MQTTTRNYLPRFEDIPWFPREAWVTAGSDADPEGVTTGASITLSGTPGTVFISGPIPTPLDHDNLSVSLEAEVSSARVGVEWCHAKRGKYHAPDWADADRRGRRHGDAGKLPVDPDDVALPRGRRDRRAEGGRRGREMHGRLRGEAASVR